MLWSSGLRAYGPVIIARSRSTRSLVTATKIPGGSPALRSFHCFWATLADGPDGALGGAGAGASAAADDEAAAAEEEAEVAGS